MVNVQGSVASATCGVVMQVLLALIFLFSTVANVLVLIIFYRRPALRTLSNRFVMSLLGFNLLATSLLLPALLMDTLIDVRIYSDPSVEQVVCSAGHILTTLVTTGSISAALVIGVDQYCAVMAPLHYHRTITKLRSWLLLAGQWIFALTMSLFSIADSSGERFWQSCRSSAAPEMAAGDEEMAATNDTSSALIFQRSNVTSAYAPGSSSSSAADDVWSILFVTCSVVSYVVPLALLTWMYVRIYSAAHRNSERTRRTSLTHSASELVVHCLGSSQMISHCASLAHIPSGSSGPGCGNGMNAGIGSASAGGLLGSVSMEQNHYHQFRTNAPSRTPSLRSTSSQIVNNLRYRISNASVFLYREESRAARVSVFVLVLVIFCWLPYHVLLLLNTVSRTLLPSYAHYMSLAAMLVNSLSSPFLYAYRSRRMQREVRRLFGLPAKSRKEGVHRMKKRAKVLRSLSPRRQILRKNAIWGADVAHHTPDEAQAALPVTAAATAAGNPQVVVAASPASQADRPQLMHTLLLKVSRLLHKPAQRTGTATSQLMVISSQVSRSSFSTNSSSSAESDVSL